MKQMEGYIICILFFLFAFARTVSAKDYFVSAVYSEENNQLPSSANCVCTDSVGFVWVGTQDGLVRYDGYEFKTYKANPLLYHTAISNNVTDIKPLPNNRLALLVLGGQTFVFDINRNHFYLYPDPQDNVGDDYIYIERIEVKNDSLYMCSSEDRCLVLGYDTVAYSRLNSPDIVSDKDKSNMSEHVSWVIDNGALVKLVHLNDYVTLNKISSKKIIHGYSKVDDIHSLLPLEKSFDYVLSNEDKQIVFKKGDETFYLSKNGSLQKDPIDFHRIKVIKKGKDGDLYLGGKNNLFHLIPKGNAFKVLTYRTQKDAQVSDILVDSHGRVWVGTENDGLYLLNADGTFMTMHDEWKSSYPPRFVSINCLYEDSKGVIWVGSTDGVTMFSSEQNDYKSIRFFFYNSETTNLIYSHITDIAEDSNGEIWFTSIGGGLYHCSSDRFLGEPLELQKFETPQTEVLLSVVPVGSSSLAILSPNSLLRVDTKSGECDEFMMDVIKGASFRNRQISFHNNNVLIPSSVGYLEVDLQNINRNNLTPNYVITGIVSNNKEVDFEENTIYLTKANNSFTINYSDLLFGLSKYKYRLKGLNKKYTYTLLPQATFTNVPHGDYVFELSSDNCDIVKTIKVKILPSWYETIWARVLFVLIALGAVWFAIRSYLIYYKRSTKKKMEDHLNQMKLNFFTDISHEIRTPLTLISAPIESLLSRKSFGPEEEKMLEVIKANSERMKSMVNELLDYSRLESDHFENNIIGQSLQPILKRVSKLFLQEADRNSINFIVDDRTNGESCDIDARQIETAIINLLSNAFKFTPKHGEIKLSACFDGDKTVISVYDSGKSLGESEKESMFQRFFTTGERENSSGIGLNIVKRIATNLSGSVDVVSEEGKGVNIIISLPRYASDYSRTSNNSKIVSSVHDKGTTLLILEDNKDLREFLIGSLEPFYNILSGENGVAGLELIQNSIPDLILSDIIMPEMDGVKFAEKVKSDSNYSHIPLVLLTAKDDMQTKIDTLGIGVTDYITKPFSIEYLQARIQNILNEREMLKKHFRGIIVEDEQEAENEDASIVEAKTIADKINELMSDEDLNVDVLCSAMNLSRLAFTSKCKTLFGLTPVELVRDMRMKKAKELLKTTDMSIQEISYAVGISDQRYFARIFKQLFGVTATKFREEQ
ncbi:MAG: response regulator [Paludibacteraceae bacterium]|nr:response regulator [Paludibacteraceae bacterium]